MILKLKYIDALRAFAILGVLMVHCNQYGANIYPALIENVFNKGALGVQLFYIASAFTLFLSLSQRCKKYNFKHGIFYPSLFQNCSDVLSCHFIFSISKWLRAQSFVSGFSFYFCFKCYFEFLIDSCFIPLLDK